MDDYTDKGFNGFLERSIDNLPQVSLDSPGPRSTSQRYDDTQVSGPLGDILKFGQVQLDGPNNRIIVRDDSNLRVVIGQQEDGSQGIIVSKQGADADIQRPQDLLYNSNLNLFQAAIVDTYIFPSGILAGGTQLLQSFKLNYREKAKIQGVPGYNAFAKIYTIPLSAVEVGLPTTMYTQLIHHMSVGELGGVNIGSSFAIGVDDTYFYINRLILNGSGGDLPYADVPVQYFIFQQSISS